MTKDQIVALDSKKHIKIWLLHKLGMTRKEIAEALGTNPGHVGNEIKKYEVDKQKQEEAEKITNKNENGKAENKKGNQIEEAIDYISNGIRANKESQSGGLSEKAECGTVAQGAVAEGPSHLEGGIKTITPAGPLEIEGGEAIINKEATAKNLELLSKINQSAGNGIAFTKDDDDAARAQAKKVTAAYGGRVASKNTENVKWFKDKQGRDRFEIDDSSAIFDYDILLLSAKASSEQNKVIILEVGNILKEWDGYKYYPEIREIKVVFSPNYSPLDFIFAYEQIQDSIYINSNNFYYDENNKRGADKKALRNDEGGAKGVEQGPSGADPATRRMDSRSRFLHEIQHALQKREGISISVSDWNSLLWALKDKTGNGKMSDNEFIAWIEDKTKAPYKNFLYSYYLTIDSEVEAHDVQNRSNLSKDDRDAIAPIIKAKQGALTTGVKIESEHENLYNELASRLEAEGSRMPMSKKEFFTKIAKAHISERPDYYARLEKYVEPKAENGDITTKPYYLLTREETISERDRLEALSPLSGKDEDRMKSLCRYSYTKFKTLLKDLK